MGLIKKIKSEKHKKKKKKQSLQKKSIYLEKEKINSST